MTTDENLKAFEPTAAACANPFVALMAPQEVLAVHERLGRRWAKSHRKVHRPLDKACRKALPEEVLAWDAEVEAQGRKPRLCA